jgi:hypothetical protein
MSAVILYSIMTDILIACLICQVLALVGTIALVTIPIRPEELRFWHVLRVHQARKWITRRRKLIQPLAPEQTVQIARGHLRWDLILQA